MGYDRGDSFPFDFEPNGNTFSSKSRGKLSPRSYPIQFERKSNTSFLSVIARYYGAITAITVIGNSRNSAVIMCRIIMVFMGGIILFKWNQKLYSKSLKQKSKSLYSLT